MISLFLHDYWWLQTQETLSSSKVQLVPRDMWLLLQCILKQFSNLYILPQMLFSLIVDAGTHKFQDTGNAKLPRMMSNQNLARSNPEPPLIAFRRPPNLRNLLVHARLSPPSTTTTLATGTSPCGGRGCKTRGIILPNNTTLASHKTGKQFTLSFRATCKTPDVVYSISVNMLVKPDSPYICASMATEVTSPTKD